MRTSASISELSKALTKAQGKMGFALKDSQNPFFKSKYADLESCISAAKSHLEENGLLVSQGGDFRYEQWVLVTLLSHTSGEWIETLCPILANKQDAQGFGSGMTYARRYAYAAIIGLTQSDDDAEAAVQQVREKQQMPEAPKAREANRPAARPNNYAPSAMSYKDYVIDFGKHKGKQVMDMGMDEMMSYISFLEDSARRDQKPLSQKSALFVQMAQAYVDAEKPGQNESANDISWTLEFKPGPEDIPNFASDDNIPF